MAQPALRQKSFLLRVVIAICALCLHTVALGAEPAWLSKELGDALQEYAGAPVASPEALERVLGAIPQRRERDLRPDRTDDYVTVYLIEGDVRSSLREACYWLSRAAGRKPPAKSRCGAFTPPAANAPIRSTKQLNVAARSSECEAGLCIWLPRHRGKLNYFVDTDSFKAGNVAPKVQERLLTVFENAVREWIDACVKCGLEIKQATTRNPSDDLQFVLDYDCSDWRDEDYAESFVPYDELPKRLRLTARLASAKRAGTRTPSLRCPDITIDDISAIDEAQWQRTLTHEIGHILGYGHEEFSKSDLMCCGASGSDERCRVEISRAHGSPYDQFSIMHSSACAQHGVCMLRNLSCEDRLRHQSFYQGGPQPDDAALSNCIAMNLLSEDEKVCRRRAGKRDFNDQQR